MWREIRCNNPSATRSVLRNKFSSLYKLLTKDDREWLQKNLPPRQDHFFDWEALDNKICSDLAEVAKQLQSAQPPKRVTLYALSRDLGYYDYLRRSPGNLPRSVRALSKILETRLDFTKRKLLSVAQSAPGDEAFLTVPNLIRLAKVSRDLVRDPEIVRTLHRITAPNRKDAVSQIKY